MMKKQMDGGFGKNKNYVPFEQLTDTPARLFRMLGNAIGLNAAMWRSLMNDHLRMIHPDDSGTPADVKKARSTSLGNAQDAYFFKHSLTFNKLLEGMKILKVRKVSITFKCELESGKEVELSESIYLRNSKSVEKDE